ncbi:MAG: hypothetical protein NTY39_03675 [Campylobacterales bacterium]|nr:hypothetical protein [Campylobacterales bacterium]
MDARGWDVCDVILVNGDAYIDSPFIGIAAVGRILDSVTYSLDSDSSCLFSSSLIVFWRLSFVI